MVGHEASFSSPSRMVRVLPARAPSGDAEGPDPAGSPLGLARRPVPPFHHIEGIPPVKRRPACVSASNRRRAGDNAPVRTRRESPSRSDKMVSRSSICGPVAAITQGRRSRPVRRRERSAPGRVHAASRAEVVDDDGNRPRSPSSDCVRRDVPRRSGRLPTGRDDDRDRVAAARADRERRRGIPGRVGPPHGLLPRTGPQERGVPQSTGPARDPRGVKNGQPLEGGGMNPKGGTSLPRPGLHAAC